MLADLSRYVDMSDSYRYAGQICLAAMPYTRLYSVHPYWWKRQVFTRCDLQDHCMQARKSAGERSSLDLKPMSKDTQIPNKKQSVASENGPWSNNLFLKKSIKKQHTI